jgi:hypothetical protein
MKVIGIHLAVVFGMAYLLQDLTHRSDMLCVEFRVSGAPDSGAPDHMTRRSGGSEKFSHFLHHLDLIANLLGVTNRYIYMY